MASQDEQAKILGGGLETLGLHATLKMLSLSNKTGQMKVTTMADRADAAHPREELDIFLYKGGIVRLISSPPSKIELLDMLQLMRLIHRRDAQDIRERTGGQLTQVLAALVERGIIDTAGQQQRMEFLITLEIARGLRWQHGTFEFINNVRIADTSIPPFSVDHVLLEALRMVDEWNKGTGMALDRNSTPRWVNDFTGEIGKLDLTRDDFNVVQLANGQHSIAAIAFALLMPEARVAQRVERLANLGLIEVVNDQLERQIEFDLMNALTVSQSQLKQDPRQPLEQRLRTLINVMCVCCNKLIGHHGQYARALRGRKLATPEVMRYLEHAILPLIRRVQRDYQVLEETVTFQNGQIDCAELLNLRALVKGEQLEHFSWDGALAFQRLMNDIFQFIIADELGPLRTSRRFYDMWETFAREVESEFERLRHRRTPSTPRRGTTPAE